MEKLFYLQNVERGFVGNSVQWYRQDGKGYVCDTRAAQKFTQEEADKMTAETKKYKAWPCELIDGLVQHHVDMQDLRAGRTRPWTMEPDAEEKI